MGHDLSAYVVRELDDEQAEIIGIERCCGTHFPAWILLNPDAAETWDRIAAAREQETRERAEYGRLFPDAQAVYDVLGQRGHDHAESLAGAREWADTTGRNWRRYQDQCDGNGVDQ